MSNTESSYCVVCGRMSSFYNVEIGIWECEECGHVISDHEVGNTGSDYPDDDDFGFDEYADDDLYDDDKDNAEE